MQAWTKTVSDWLTEKRKAAESGQAPPASRQHFDVWGFHTADGDSSYFGRMPPQVVERASVHVPILFQSCPQMPLSGAP